MLTSHEYKGARWIDINEPSPEEIRDLASEHGIDELVARELRSPSDRHRIETKDTYLYLILHFPLSKSEGTEIDFIVGKDFVITVRYEQVDALDRFEKIIEVGSVIDRDPIADSRDVILFGILKELASDMAFSLERNEHEIRDIEKHVFDGDEKAMVMALSQVSRRLLDWKKVILPHREMLEALAANGQSLFGTRFAEIARSVSEDFAHHEAEIREQMESVAELRETNNALLDTKENDLMRRFTVMNLVVAFLVGVALVWLGYLALE